ncbi:acyl-CoA thioesterase [Paenibacillus yanchengensis]|uniref:Acyl-CoA thioesterase n=1 Tax=Paenibacillus yanchengensis TaxID=2035833 RepID=A0ABW4YLH6_9BACL
MKQQGWVVHPLRVRYQETDQMGVVFHANYLTWLEMGRTEWVRQHGFTYKEMEDKGVLLPIIDLQCKFVSPARYDDHVIVCTTLTESSRLQMKFTAQIRKVDEAIATTTTLVDDPLPGELLVQAETNHVFVNKQLKPIRILKIMPELASILT